MKSNSSSLIIGFAMIISVAILGLFLMFTFGKDSSNEVNTNNEYRYELITTGSNVILFDKDTGEYWKKFFDSNEGPVNWEKDSPLDKDK
ncbi:hypothetical protein [Bacillus sp. 179-C3.3 HS]|uniref:hypothetical protein n=1 Tax=Bacillus sp. 179-C3.3 HS TaxID=3232162 RepID=UPI0039A38375